MNEDRQDVSGPTHIMGGHLSEAERMRRQRAVETACASTRLSGIELPPEVMALNQRYIDDEITSEQLTTAIKGLVGRQDDGGTALLV